MLTSNQFITFRKQLLEQKQEILTQIEENDHFDLERGHFHESMGELSSYDNHPADEGSALYEREKDISLLEHAKRELDDIEAALQALKDGTYGTCKECGKDIPVERLDALPTALYCKEHSPDQEVSHQRPIEEGVLIPPFGKFEYDDLDVEAYDAEDSWQDVQRFGTSETPSDFIGDRDSYNEMFIESDENVGFVEDYENFVATDMEGKEVFIVPSNRHRQYEEMLDEAGMMSILGDLPPYEKHPYTEEALKREQDK
ncbi:yteA family sporulation protein [Bacillus sp. HMF5848]|uniref:TraR/DksA C4-type zinc finger protein n=1 Tax=Bacillus sp. HMF5848 TaxID=2495421 RepID=UPI000F7B3494|nr:TraR/DksA C4-type zinc finger protein [Bacillus sp. HMF5848]RSK28283.1 yteA family sporulation protein [Bacillus sp. HMF5848]